jgi:hypothetical protein
MHSPAEIWFRFRQEWENYRLYRRPPEWRGGREVAWPLALPAREQAAARLRGTPAGNRILELAGRIGGGEIPVFEQWIRVGDRPAWRADFATGQQTDLSYFRRIPYLDVRTAGDHKRIWELNRHQHLVTLAQAWVLSADDTRYLAPLWRQLQHWIADNPFQCGINWTSALEVAFRAWSWCWIWHLAGDRMPAELRQAFLESLYRHGRHLAVNLSVYFSPNTHLLGEALVLATLGHLFPSFPEAEEWRRVGGGIVRSQYRSQVAGDGSHIEQSSYYHVYALDMFLWFQVLEPPGAEEREVTDRMAGFLSALAGGQGRIPLLGDDDGGRWFHPYGDRRAFCRSTLAVHAAMRGGSASRWQTEEELAEVAVWWLGDKARAAGGPGAEAAAESQWFPDVGLAVLRAGEWEVLFDAGPFGPWSGGHSHADTLSLTVRQGGEDRLVDPGTFTYVSDPALRSWFRSARAHNTVTVGWSGPDGGWNGNQAEETGPFGWRVKPAVRVLARSSGEGYEFLDAECRYGPVTHRRAVQIDKRTLDLWVADRIDGPAGVEAEFGQHWHCAPEWPEKELLFATENPAEVTIEESWRSPVLHTREPIPAIAVRWQSVFPSRRAAVFRLGGKAGAPVRLTAHWQEKQVMLRCGSGSEGLDGAGGLDGEAVLKLEQG